MRKRKTGRKLSRKSDQRKALLKSLANSLFEKGKIQTTEAKAKETAIFVSKIITRAKNKDLATQRELSKLFSQRTVKKLTEVISPKYVGRAGGYTRIFKIGPRKSDSARMAIIELV